MDDILNFGSINYDRVYQVSSFVEPGETVPVTDFAIGFGGKGFNQSTAIARAGGAVTHVGVVGPDGGALVDFIRAEGVTAAIQVSDEPTGHAVIEVNRDGENRILIAAGANHRFDERQIAEALRRPPCWVLLQNETNAVTRIVTEAKRAGHRVAINTAPATTELKALDFPSIDLLIANTHELRTMTELDDIDAGIDALRRLSPDMQVVVTLGAEGSVYDYAGERTRCPAVGNVQAVDTTGAGDTFVGYFIVALIEGRPARECLEFAAAAAALCVQQHGAVASVPMREAVEALLQNT